MKMSPALAVAMMALAVLFLLAWVEARRAGEFRTLASRVLAGRAEGAELGGVRHELRRLQRRLPQHLVQADERRLEQASIGLGSESLLGLRLLALAAGTVAFSLLGSMWWSRVRMPAGIWAASGALAGLLWVELAINSAIRRWRSELRREWPSFLHRLELCLLAGMPLERSTRVIWLAAQHDGRVIARGLTEVVREMAAGASCEEALAGWAARSASEDIEALWVVCQRSRRLGMPLAPAIARQTMLARTRSRQRHLAWLTSLPGRISLVAMVFFMPAILIVVLLPSVLSFLRSGW